MKCTTHNAEAVAICTWCGRALCADCLVFYSESSHTIKDKGPRPRVAGRAVCSDQCIAALGRESRAMDMVLQKSLQSTRATTFYYFLCAALTAAGGVGAWYYLPSPFLIWFCFGAAAVFTASGLWYLRIARNSS